MSGAGARACRSGIGRMRGIRRRMKAGLFLESSLQPRKENCESCHYSTDVFETGGNNLSSVTVNSMAGVFKNMIEVTSYLY